MGSSGWYYFTPYQENLKTALSQLRDQVFAAGDYYHPLTFYKQYVKSEHFDQLSTEEQTANLTHLQTLETQGLPPTIDALLERNAEGGTHSILDINYISEETAFHAAAPLPDQVLLELFDTTQPNHSMVEAKLDILQGIRFRWCGSYVIIYENNQPHEICFVGNSGD